MHLPSWTSDEGAPQDQLAIWGKLASLGQRPWGKGRDAMSGRAYGVTPLGHLTSRIAPRDARLTVIFAPSRHRADPRSKGRLI